ncbi:permease component of an ABC superfamily dipeptide transporter [Tatumella ptyseos ATCC 33301]|uniref:Permease component of an ABC superfamily dipeptide transporter n=2 Tax=Tatumella ptyseos TaxID=82987 RepID=A0A085JPS8_9GAMM|nr:ABC transporter permease [Tatumella ptyseos]KFD22474.1 permease component of an ABC superfamily dipeptide transporter [Tatumella ptyseos ATCC 33301]SQK72264.1 Probable D,D-dipeptide transport system permease protein ddpC [Tatumella ptyseos]
MSLTETLRLQPRRSGKYLQLQRVRPGVWLAWMIILLAILAAIFPQLLTHYDPESGVPGTQLMPPDSHHWLGTDQLGRDLYSRIIYGARWSLSAASAAVSVGLVVGSLGGMLAAFSGRTTETLTMRLVDVLLSIPALLLSLTIIILLGAGTLHAALAVGCASVAHFARLSRAEVLRIRQQDYIEAAFGSGGRFFAVFFRHVLPNALPNILAFSALQFGQAILALSTLSFLGFGSPPPIPEWGLLIAEGRNYLATAWWLTVFPGVVVIGIVLATNRISRALSGENL